MKERPIIFNTEMVKAILEGRKTQTRRPIKPQPKYTRSIVQSVLQPEKWALSGTMGMITCPFGKVGDRLEVWRETGEWLKKHFAKKEHIKAQFVGTRRADITLEITDVRVERVGDISEEDAELEGAIMTTCANVVSPKDGFPSCISGFGILWDSIYGEKAFERNDWVWAITYKAIDNEL